jgi:DNA repair exonuclease SbcCD ATPase subunit
LEDVLTMLRQLGSHGRLVGLISHVPEMKTAISERISVVQAGENRPTRLDVSWM